MMRRKKLKGEGEISEKLRSGEMELAGVWMILFLEMYDKDDTVNMDDYLYILLCLHFQ